MCPILSKLLYPKSMLHTPPCYLYNEMRVCTSKVLSYGVRVIFLWSTRGRGVHLGFPYGMHLLRIFKHISVPEVGFLLELHDGIMIPLSEFLYFRRQRVISFHRNTIICFHELIILPLRQEHASVCVVATMHLILDHLIKLFIRLIILEWGPYLLVALVSLFPLPDLWDQTSFKVMNFGLEVMLFSGGRLVSHEHSFHQIIHHLHHQI
jgi:hypothetical protein